MKGNVCATRDMGEERALARSKRRRVFGQRAKITEKRAECSRANFG
jgi:hypothetical protein